MTHLSEMKNIDTDTEIWPRKTNDNKR